MNIKTLLLTGLAPFIALQAIASGDVAQTSDPLVKTFITNRQRVEDARYQNELRNTATWQNFKQQNAGWNVVFNENSGMPHRAYGAPVSLPFAGTAAEKATWFINNYLGEFNVPVNDLRLRASTVSQKHNNVKFIQTYQGLDVLYSDVYVKMTKDGNVILFGLDCFNNINVSTTPSLSRQAAENAATVSVPGVNSVTSTPALKILPIPQYRNYDFRLVYEIMVTNTDAENIPGQYYTLIDANTGEVLYRYNRVSHAANTDVTLTGTYYLTHNYNPSTVNPLTNMKVIVNGVPGYTDATGFVGFTNTTPVSATIRLEGLWSSTNTNGTVPSWTTTLNPGANNILFDPHANIKEMSAFNSVNVVHEYMKTKFPAFTDLDFPLTTNVDVAGSCNAFYNGTSINFYDAGGGCNATSTVADVVYHEYGHAINDYFYTSLGGFWDNGAMGEGYADIWALGITESPILGIGFFAGDPNGFVRRYDQDRKVYPQDLTGEVHADGEIIAGAWWDVGVNLADVQQMMEIYKETYFALLTAANGDEGILYHDILIEALEVDDNDGNINNGTPHYCEITSAFALHGLTVSGASAGFTHTEILSAPPQTPISVDVVAASLPNAALPYGYYKINGAGSWTSFALNNIGGNNYSGTIPGQPNGTIVHYYLDLFDTCGTHVGVTPQEADDPVNPNIPYYILVGFNLLSDENFDAASGTWSLSAPGDNATTGLWLIGSPVPSYLDPGNQTGQVQTDIDHSSNATNICAVTGNAATGDGAGTQDIDGGHTTLTSPVLDLTSYTNPAFEYWRWYSNDQGATPGTDFWLTYISDDGGTTWVPIENIDVADHSWRRFAFKVLDYVTLTNQVRIKFEAGDENTPSLVESAVDDFKIYDEIPTSVNELQSITAFSVYPNPANQMLNVRWNQLKEEDISIQITDNLGRVIFQVTPQTITTGVHSVNIPVSQFESGIYFLKMNGQNSNIVKKITVMN